MIMEYTVRDPELNSVDYVSAAETDAWSDESDLGMQMVQDGLNRAEIDRRLEATRLQKEAARKFNIEFSSAA